uniref:Uncharacterized protein n=1 Tax=Knipowitschia caucasica TaxID=637954 RepID=A0AAV2IXA2_KNICA
MPFLRGARPSQAGQASGRHTGHPAHVMTLIEGFVLLFRLGRLILAVHVIPQAVVHPQAPARSATLFPVRRCCADLSFSCCLPERRLS